MGQIVARQWIKFGSWWAIQYDGNRPIALGFHVELRRMPARPNMTYGPYIDIHVPYLIISIGRHPIYTYPDDMIRTYSRGGNPGEKD